MRLGVLQVASEDDEVWPLGIDAVDGPMQDIFVALRIAADMGIREKYDLISVEGFWQGRGGIVLTVDFQLVEAYERSVDEDIPDDRHTEESHQIAVVPASFPLMEQAAESQSDDGAEHEHCLGDGDESEQYQINP